jgi:hypothetical protein
MNKICSKCNRELPVGAFGTFKKVLHGHYWCKECVNAAHAAWRKTEAGKACDKRYNDSPAHMAMVRAYQATDKGKEVAKKVKEKYEKTDKWQIVLDRYHKTEKYREKCHREAKSEARQRALIKHYLKRRAIAGQKLCDAMKAGIYLSLKTKKNGRKWESLVNYTATELMEHLEKQFQPGMTWENYGEWHVDHIQPRAAHYYIDSTDPDFQRCWALDNLQPLWASDNKLKSAKIVEPFQPTLDLMFKSTQALDRIG